MQTISCFMQINRHSHRQNLKRPACAVTNGAKPKRAAQGVVLALARVARLDFPFPPGEK
jgi:hypothetical protein